MRFKGRITTWNAERGFGFVTPVGGGERVFFLHVTAISDRHRAPAEGDMVTYDLTFDDRKRPRAASVKRSMPLKAKSESTAPSISSSTPGVIASLFMLFVVAAVLKGWLPVGAFICKSVTARGSRE